MSSSSSSSYEYLSIGRYNDLSGLEKFRNELELDILTKRKLDRLYLDFHFLDIFVSLRNLVGSYEDACLVAMKKVDALFAATEFERINCPNDLESALNKFEEPIREIKLELKAKYFFPKPLSSNFTNPEYVKRFIDVAIMKLSDLRKISERFTGSVFACWQQMEEIVKELKLLRNLVYFVSDRCADTRSQFTFFSHVLFLAGHAAMISWCSVSKYWNERVSREMNMSFSDLPMTIQPIQPGIRKIYINVLKAIKSGRYPHIQAKNVVHHMKKLCTITDKHKERVGFKDRITMFNFLRDYLINLPRVVIQDFDTAIINVGLLVYSIYYSMATVDIQSIKALIYFLTRKSFCTNLPKIDGLGSIDIILDHLKEFLNLYPDSLSSIRSKLWTIQQQLEHFQKQHEGFGSFGMQMITKAYEVDHLLVGCITKDIPGWCLIPWIEDIIEEIAKLMREAAEIHKKKLSDLVLHNTIDVASAHTSEFARITSMREEMVGFQEVMDTLRRQLIGGSSHLDVISIVGMAGLGKTTLANKLFLDQLVVSHFDVRAQCCVSQVYTRKDLLLTILRGVKKDTVISDKLPENELADKLQKLLKVQRYLIFIDDVWETSAWDDLYPCFCDVNKGSRIILTTRLAKVASHTKHVSDPHLLRMFTTEESWMLLKDKVFNKKSCPAVLEDIGKKIARKCGGLPLSVVLVAGILETMKKEKHCWEQVALNLCSHIQSKLGNIINLSYQELPFHLKPCFLYFGVFLEDEEIQVSKLTRLWTAEGLVLTQKDEVYEDIAENYLTKLIGRNLVMVSKKSSDGKAKTCRVHDLLLEFCKQKAKVENFLQCIHGDNDDMGPSSISYRKHNIPRRLCLYLQGDSIARWSSICSDVKSFHLMKGRQIGLFSIGHASHTFNSFKFLWVLDLEFAVIDSFPEALTCLRYVAVTVAEDSSLSFSDNNLWNLETLIVKGLGGRVTLPDNFWKMVKLRHLRIFNQVVLNINNALHPMDSLRTLSSARFSSVDETNGVIAMIPNLQKLRCEVLSCDSYSPEFSNLTKLEILNFSWERRALAPTLKLPDSLKKLTLSKVVIASLDKVSILPKLAVLKLIDVSINSGIWKVTDEHFSNLKFLKLQDPSFFKWDVSGDAFPCLEHLVLRRLRHLEEIPPRFSDMPTLKSIEVMSCKESLVESAKDIRETQIEEMQNCGFKLFIQK